MLRDETLSIGELAARTGATVKTVRYYSDRGLLPEAVRSTGGHRRYGPEAVERLRRVRSLRALGLSLPEASRLLAHPEEDFGGALESAAARKLGDLGTELTALRWREAALRLLHESPPELRAERLLLVGGLEGPPDTTDLARFWRRLLPPGIPRRLLDIVVESAVVRPPADPTPQHVLDQAELHTLATKGRLSVDLCVPFSATHPYYRVDVLYEGLVEAVPLASAHLRAGRPPHEGDALDCFVAAHARARGARDTLAFRRDLSRHLARTADPMIERYWQLASRLAPADEPTPGAVEDWHRAALDGQLARADA